MGIVEEDIARVRTETDIVQVISGYTQLKRVGSRFTGLCPFHTERSGSFSVNAEQNVYHCFGCKVGGDVITFVREKEGFDFVEAIEWLANKSGIALRYTDANQGKDRQQRDRLQKIIESAAQWYHELLLTDRAAAPARAYLRERGFTGELVRKFQIGWAPDDWDQLAKHLKVSNKDLVDSGLGLINRRNRQQDWFRARVLFPITDVRGNHIGFGGRVLPGGEGAKYMNSKDSVVYNKSSVLYGLDRAKADIVAKGEVVICEGYTDVIGYDIAGVSRGVATCGTALTERHVKELKKYATRVVLSFDGDAAGQNAAARFYEWERQYDLDVRVVDLPAGADPGELAFKDPDRLAAAVADARPFLEFRVNRVLAAADLGTVEGRARAAEAALAVVAEHPDSLVQDAYALQIADHTQMAPETVRSMLRTPGALPSADARAGTNNAGSQSQRGGPQNRAPSGTDRRNGARPAGGRDGGRTALPEAELLALRLAIQDPGGVSQYIVPELFSVQRLGDLYALLIEHGNVTTVTEMVDQEDQRLVFGLAVDGVDVESLDVACRLWSKFVGKERDRRRREVDYNSPDDAASLAAELRWFQDTLEALSSDQPQELTVSQLLAWVGSGSEEVDR